MTAKDDVELCSLLVGSDPKRGNPLKEWNDVETCAANSLNPLRRQADVHVEDEDDSEHPSMAAISYDQLLEVEELARKEFGWGYRSKSMRDIVAKIVIPRQRGGKSYALTKNSEGLKGHVFITHCWDERFADFVDSITETFRSYPKRAKPNLWICAFALRQGSHRLIQEQVEVPLSESPFVQALRCARSFVVVRNAQTDLYSRIWCVCELMYAKRYGFTTATTQVVGPNKFANLRTSCLHAQAFNPKDRDRVLRALLLHDVVHGNNHKSDAANMVKEIDDLVQQYRNHCDTQRVLSIRHLLHFQMAVLCLWLWLVYVFYPTPATQPLSNILQEYIQANETDTVTRFHFEFLDVKGTISTEIGLFTNLVYVSSMNQLAGTLPSELGLLTALTRLGLTHTYLSGPIPTELGALTCLVGLYLGRNALTGLVPTELAQLTKLEEMGLTHTYLSGPIPTELGALTCLEGLYLGRNALTGSVPTELAQLTKLEEMGLESNQLSGPIPSELGKLRGLVELRLDGNGLSGLIPKELSQSTSLKYLSLGNNSKLHGTIPTELGRLTSLNSLLLEDCALTGSIPSEIGLTNITQSQHLALEGNRLSGPIPSDLESLADIKDLAGPRQ